jgi:hypothetical protein
MKSGTIGKLLTNQIFFALGWTNAERNNVLYENGFAVLLRE